MIAIADLKKGREEGFSLIELLVVVLIIGILATIAIPSLLRQRDKAKNANAQETVRTALTASKSYYTDNERYEGMTNTELSQEEKSLDPAAPAGAELTPGDGAVPAKIFISGTSYDPAAPAFPVTVTGAAVTATNPKEVVLCSVSQGDSIYCIYDNQSSNGPASGKTFFKRFQASADGTDVWTLSGAATDNVAGNEVYDNTGNALNDWGTSFSSVERADGA